VLDDKRRLEVRIANLERQTKELKAKLAELETAQTTNTKATIVTLNTKSNNLEGSLKVRVIPAAARDG
jgi:chromosome segregation ATPase